MNVRQRVLEILSQVILNELGHPRQIEESSSMEQTGLDSLGFAVLIATLEAELGYDPFVLEENPEYPETVAGLIDIYERHYQNNDV